MTTKTPPILVLFGLSLFGCEDYVEYEDIYRDVGEECGGVSDSDAQCKSGLCVNRVCIAPKAVGQNCSESRECESNACEAGKCVATCRTTLECDLDDDMTTPNLLVCKTPADGAGRCVEPCTESAEGLACIDGVPFNCGADMSEAQRDLYCEFCGCPTVPVPQYCSTEGVLGCQNKLSSDEPCTDDVECLSGMCVDGACQLASGGGGAAVGETCAADDDCESGNCSDTSMVCQVAVGAECTDANCDRCWTFVEEVPDTDTNGGMPDGGMAEGGTDGSTPEAGTDGAVIEAGTDSGTGTDATTTPPLPPVNTTFCSKACDPAADPSGCGDSAACDPTLMECVPTCLVEGCPVDDTACRDACPIACDDTGSCACDAEMMTCQAPAASM